MQCRTRPVVVACLAVAVLLGGAIPAAGLELVVKPYLNYPTTESIIVRWETDAPATSLVRWEKKLPLKEATSIEGTRTLHEVRIEGLEAGAPYFYQVVSRDEAGSEVESEVWVYWYSWGYWGGYPGWGWYYPPYLGSASFQQGTVVWQLHDLRGDDDPSDPEARPPLNWVGALNGALSSSASTTHSEIRSGIKQAFAQSPYITASGAGN